MLMLVFSEVRCYFINHKLQQIYLLNCLIDTLSNKPGFTLRTVGFTKATHSSSIGVYIVNRIETFIIKFNVDNLHF